MRTLVPVLCLAGLLAACGGGAGTTAVTTDVTGDAEFVAALGELCEQRQRDFLAATDVSFDTDRASGLERASAALEAQKPFVDAIEQLDVPTHKAVEYSHFVDNRVALLGNTARTVAAWEKGDEKKAVQIQQDRAPLIVQDRARSKSLGVAPCVGELAPDDVAAVTLTIETDVTTADPAACSEIYTDFYLAGFGGKGQKSVQNCERVAAKYEPADSVEVEVEGFTGEASVTVMPTGGQNDGNTYLYALRKVDGEWLINQIVLSGEDAASVKWCPADEGDRGFDTSRIIGLTEAEAANLAAAEGDCLLRVVERDGEPLPATMDFNPSRINVEIEKDKVTAIASIG